jgi:flagellar M-ring protein FliF
MNELLKRLLGQARGLWARWNTTQKIILFAVLGAGIIAVILLFTLSAAPAMVPVINAPVASADERMAISAKLDELGIDYKLRPDNIFYAADKATAMRAKNALFQNNLVPSGTDPWAFFDVERWTTTDFERNVNLQRAITKQLEQHILALEDVDNVNVTLVVPQDELFAEDQKPVTASVILTPKPGSDLTANRKKLEGIQRLIKFAVAGLSDQNIVITDQNGVTLNDFTGLADVDRLELVKRELKVKQELEAKYTAQIMNALGGIYSADRVRIIRIDIDLDMSKRSSTAEEFTPIIMKPDNPKTPYDESERTPAIPRSTQSIEEHFQGTGFNPEGPPGQEGQTPPAYKDLSNLVGKYDKSSQTVNNEINKKVTTEEKRPWDINRITASVALDGVWRWKYDMQGKVMLNRDGSIQREYVPVADEDIAKLKGLVEGAIGIVRERGDYVQVQHVAFERTRQFEKEDGVFRRQIATRRTITWALVGLGAVLLIVLAYRLIAKEAERRRRLREEELARQHQAMREAALRTAEEQGVEVELSVEDRARLEMQENAVNMAREHPEDVAQLIRTWLVEE